MRGCRCVALVGSDDVVGLGVCMVQCNEECVGGCEGVTGRVCYLSALVRTHSHVPVRAARETGVHARAERRFALFAVAAAPVGDVEGENDAVALFKERHAAADFFDDAHIFVPCLSFSVTLSRLCVFGGWRDGFDGVGGNGWLPNMSPLSAAVRPWYMCRSEPQIAGSSTIS